MSQLQNNILDIFNFNWDTKDPKTILVIGLGAYAALAVIVSLLFGIFASASLGYISLTTFVSFLFFVFGTLLAFNIDKKMTEKNPKDKGGFTFFMVAIVIIGQITAYVFTNDGTTPLVILLPGLVLFIIMWGIIAIQWLSKNFHNFFPN